ncbi:pro-adrenomedullin-like [Rhinoraja longicauda]
MDDDDQSAKTSRTFSDSGQHMKLDGTSDISTVLHSRVKRHRHGLGQQNYHRQGRWGCRLTTCQTHNLANWLYQIAASKGKDGTAPKNTSDPHSYGKKRRRRSIFLPAYSTRVAQ